MCDAERVSAAGRPYAGKSQADRREERRAQLLAAGLRLIGEQGLAAVTVRGICTKAGLTPRYFYEEFGTVEELARRLFDREFDLGLARVGVAVAAAGEDTTTRVRAAVGAVLDLFTEEPHRIALLLTEATGAGALAERRRQRMDDVIAVLAAFGRSTYGGDAPPAAPAAVAAADRAVRVAATFVAGGLTQAVDAWFAGAMPGTREALERDLTAQIVAVGDAAFASLTERPA